MEKQAYILVVDDDPDILDGILAVLESQPYRVLTARDGRRCLEMIQLEAARFAHPGLADASHGWLCRHSRAATRTPTTRIFPSWS